MLYQAHDAYLESAVLSADPLELIRILYGAALEAVGNARRCLAEGDILGRSRHITRTHAILTELSLTLNHEAGGEIARRLAELYDYMQRRLLDAHTTQRDEPLAEVASLLAVLLEGWRNCRPATQSGPAMDVLPEPETLCADYVAQSWTG
jgi:flagellar protein FliS